MRPSGRSRFEVGVDVQAAEGDAAAAALLYRTDQGRNGVTFRAIGAAVAHGGLLAAGSGLSGAEVVVLVGLFTQIELLLLNIRPIPQ